MTALLHLDKIRIKKDQRSSSGTDAREGSLTDGVFKRAHSEALAGDYCVMITDIVRDSKGTHTYRAHYKGVM